MDITLIDFISLDGVVQAPGGPEEDTDGGFAHGGWSHPYFDPDAFGPAISLDGVEALIYGRRTWQGMAAAWPDRAGDPFADAMNAMPKWVATRSLAEEQLTWENSRLLDPADAVAAVADLRANGSGVAQIWGSPDFASQLIAADLVDAMTLLLEPVLLGGGKRLFPDDGVARALTLESVTQASTGVLVCRYTRAA